MQNPYQSPQSAAMPAIALPGKRPLSVWLLLFSLLVMTLLAGFVTIGSIWFAVALPGWLNWRYALDVGIRLAIVAFFAGAIVSIVQRQRVGRGLGLLVIVGLTAAVMLMPDTANYANETQRSGGLFGRMVLFPSLMALWAYRFGISATAKRYFGR